MTMKITFAAILFAIVAFILCPTVNSQERMVWNILYVTNSSTSVPTNFTAGVSATTNIFASVITVIGKASPRSANTSTCYVGTTATDDMQPYPIVSGGQITITAPAGKTFNLKDLWVDVGSANDGITIIYK